MSQCQALRPGIKEKIPVLATPDVIGVVMGRHRRPPLRESNNRDVLPPVATTTALCRKQQIVVPLAANDASPSFIFGLQRLLRSFHVLPPLCVVSSSIRPLTGSPCIMPCLRFQKSMPSMNAAVSGFVYTTFQLMPPSLVRSM